MSLAAVAHDAELEASFPSFERLDLELACRSLAEFVQQGWHTVEPATKLEWNWHLDLLCRALEEQARGNLKYRKLLIEIPPGTMKSLIVSVFAPAWQWLEQPERRKLFFSNDDKLAVRDSRRMRDVINSHWYARVRAYVAQRKNERPWYIAHDQNEKINFENSKKGFRQCLSLGANVTGKRADDICIDDPIDAKEVINGSIEQVRTRLEEANNVIEKVLPNRVNDLATACWTLVMQRLHTDDPAGRAQAENEDGEWMVISLQMEFEPGNPKNHPSDPRSKPGDLLHEKKFPKAEVEKLKKKLDRHYSAQYQQNPLPADGGPLKKWYWCFWYPQGAVPPPPVRFMKPDGTLHTAKQMMLPLGLGGHMQSWDMAFKDTKDSAYVVGQVWASKLADSFLLDQIRDKMDILATIDAVRALTKTWPQALGKLIEDKANGPAVMKTLQREIAGFDPVEPDGGKEARANAVAPVCRSGNVWLPHPSVAPWVNGLLLELESFPGTKYADQVDALTQFLNRRYGSVMEYGYTPAAKTSSVRTVGKGIL